MGWKRLYKPFQSLIQGDQRSVARGADMLSDVSPLVEEGTRALYPILNNNMDGVDVFLLFMGTRDLFFISIFKPDNTGKQEQSQCYTRKHMEHEKDDSMPFSP